MRRFLGFSFASIIITAVLAAVPTQGSSASSPPGGRGGPLDAYTAVVTADQLATLAELGFDLHEQEASTGDRIEVQLIVDRSQAARLRAQGFDLELTRVRGGKTVRQFAAAQAANGFQVWRSYDEDGGIEDQLRMAARQNPQIAKLVKIGESIQGRDILALKLTQGARDVPDGSRPAVLYSSTQHAREWISTEVNRRLMFHFINRWRANDRQVRGLLKSTELWFVLVANPDGYQYTFDHERLWRKNLRDNNGDGQITVGDGVDLNRNFPNHWGYDNEGSSPIPSSETYRGTRPESEPETEAMTGLLDRIGFAFQVNYHSNGEWLLYADGWQIATPTADDPIYHALSGNLDEPAIEGYHPGLSSDVLYVTNGETTDYAHAQNGTLAWTPELAAGCPGCGFVFPDNDELVQAEFERNLPFAMSVARSAGDPDDPKTVTGIETEPFYFESADPYKRGLPEVQLSFTKSYGDPQPVAVLAKKSLGDVSLKYRIGDGAVQTGDTTVWEGGSSYSQTSAHYHQVRGVVRGAEPGDTVEVWFEGGGETSDSFTYEVVSDSDRRVLVVAAEDYTGASPAQTPGPHFLDEYLAALQANNVQADVYDIDANSRVAPDALGVLSHYDAVVWYTGHDLVTRTAGRGGGNADRLALDQLLEMRSYLNEGGKVLYAGDSAGQQYTGNVGNQFYDPKGEIACNPLPAGTDTRRCLLLRGSGDGTNDVLQYYLGGYLGVANDGRDGPTAYDGIGADDPFAGFAWSMDDPVLTTNDVLLTANNVRRSSFVSTSGILPADQFKQFESWPAARWDKPGGPFDPHSGEQYVYSQLADVSYKRLTREIAVPADGGSLTFWTSYDTEHDWDFLFVEARTAGQDDWTTLPDANGHTSQSTGPNDPDLASCPAGWHELHPHLAHYQTWDGEGACTPTGTTGEWHANSGNSSGWQEWEIDLSGYAGETVEISIAYVSDWAIQNLGVFVDDVTLPDGSTTSFEEGLDGWTIAGPAEGSGPNANNFIRTDASGFPVGNAIATPRSLLLGFGLEGVSTEEERNQLMGRALHHLLE